MILLTGFAAVPAAVPPAALPAGLCDWTGGVFIPACPLPGPLPLGPGAVTGGITGDIAAGLGDAAMRGLTGFVVDGAVWLIGQVAVAATASTQVRVQAGWSTGHYRQMTGIAAVFTAAFLVWQCACMSGRSGNFPPPASPSPSGPSQPNSALVAAPSGPSSPNDAGRK